MSVEVSCAEMSLAATLISCERIRRVSLIFFGWLNLQLIFGYLCKSMADSCREMPSKRVDDDDGRWHWVCGGRANADWQGAMLFAGDVGLSRHCPWTTLHRPSSQVAAWWRCLHAAGCSATTTTHPVWTSPPAARRQRSHPRVDLYMDAGVKFWTFLMSKERVDLYVDWLIRHLGHLAKKTV